MTFKCIVTGTQHYTPKTLNFSLGLLPSSTLFLANGVSEIPEVTLISLVSEFH